MPLQNTGRHISLLGKIRLYLFRKISLYRSGRAPQRLRLRFAER